MRSEAKRPPVVLSRDEVEAILTQLNSAPHLACTLVCGSRLRLLEALQLRVKAIDFRRGKIVTRDGKGQKDRVTMLPGALLQALQDNLRRVRQQYQADVKNGLRQVPLPSAGPKVPKSRPRVRLAIGISCFVSLRPPKDGRPVSSPPARISDSRGRPSGGVSGWRERSDLDWPVGIRLGGKFSQFGLCYFSESVDDPNSQFKFQDNVNVIFEAGMFQSLTNPAATTDPIRWIPIREPSPLSPPPPFDFAQRRMIIVERLGEDSRPNLDKLRVDLKARLQHLLR